MIYLMKKINMTEHEEIKLRRLLKEILMRYEISNTLPTISSDFRRNIYVIKRERIGSLISELVMIIDKKT